MSQSNKTLWQAVKFTLFSVSAGIIQIGSFTLFNEAFRWSYWAAYLPSLVLSVLWNFTFNRRYTFRSDANIPRAMGLVALFYLVFTPLSTWGGDALNAAGWNEYLVLALTMGLFSTQGAQTAGAVFQVDVNTEFLYQRLVVYRQRIDTNDVARRALARQTQAK